MEEQQQLKSLTIYDTMNKEPGTKEFLESISRNSKGTQKVYAAGLVMFHKFLGVKIVLLVSSNL
jgi:hypothetical protein